MDTLRKDIIIYKGTNKDLTINPSIEEVEYTVQEGDILALSVLNVRSNNSVVITKTITGSNVFSFVPSDTSSLDVGFYRYNIKLTKNSDGKIYEIVSPSVFFIKAAE